MSKPEEMDCPENRKLKRALPPWEVSEKHQVYLMDHSEWLPKEYNLLSNLQMTKECVRPASHYILLGNIRVNEGVDVEHGKCSHVQMILSFIGIPPCQLCYSYHHRVLYRSRNKLIVPRLNQNTFYSFMP